MKIVTLRVFAPDPEREFVALAMKSSEEAAIVALDARLDPGMKIPFVYPEGTVSMAAAEMYGIQRDGVVILDPPDVEMLVILGEDHDNGAMEDDVGRQRHVSISNCRGEI